MQQQHRCTVLLQPILDKHLESYPHNWKTLVEPLIEALVGQQA
jgi:hypothetical protein